MRLWKLPIRRPGDPSKQELRAEAEAAVAAWRETGREPRVITPEEAREAHRDPDHPNATTTT